MHGLSPPCSRPHAAAYNRYLDLTLEPPRLAAAAADESAGQQPAATCELALLGKDGIFLMQAGRVMLHLIR